MKTKVAAYCRVSTKDKDQLQSLEHQQTYFNREFSNNEQYELYRVYADEGKSGTKLSRPSFDIMISDAGVDKTKIDGDLFMIVDKPKFNRILVKNTSRFARNLSADMLIKTLTKNGVYIDFIDIGLSTEKTADAIALGVLQLLDQEESKDKSRKTSFGIIEGARKGNLLINGKIYGYRYIQHENRLEIIEEEAEIIKRMFKLYNDNIGAYRISNILMKDGVVKRDGTSFTEGNIRRIIENEKYCGRLIRQKYDTGVVFNKNRTPRKRTKEEQIIFETSDKVPAIISVEDYEKAQNIRLSKTQHIIQKGVNHGSTEYAHKVYCGSCGSQYTATSTKQYGVRKERYFACVKKRKMACDDNDNRVMLCDNKNVSETKLNAELTSDSYNRLVWQSITSTIQLLRILKKIIEENITKTDTSEVERLKEQLAIKEKKISELLQFFVDGTLEREYIDNAAEPLQKEVDEIKARLTALTKPYNEKQRDLEEIISTIATLTKRKQSIADNWKNYTRKEILNDVEKIMVYADGESRFVFKSFNEVKSMFYKHIHLVSADQRDHVVEMIEVGLIGDIALFY